jgi:Sulfotransferase domain
VQRSSVTDALLARKTTVPTPVRAAIRRTFRAYGILTSGLRPLPDFLIIGTKRGGTTSLYRYLAQHPAVVPPFPLIETVKGVHYFDEQFDRSPLWYRSHFRSKPYLAVAERLRGQGLITGEASPNYLFHPLAAVRARATVPDAKIIVLLRNPIDRAYSHYRDMTKLGLEPLSFEDAIEQEPARLEGEVEKMLADPSYFGAAYDRYSYLARGRYVQQVPAWIEAFPPAQVLILPSEDLYTNPGRVYQRVLDLLGLPALDLPSYGRHNSLPASKLDRSIRRRLADYFAPHNQALFELLGMDFGWDRLAPPAGPTSTPNPIAGISTPSRQR